jgi:ribosomal-protein-alanine N-acetyltransferase
LITHHDLGLARPSEAQRIAEISRDFIESGLGWSWRPARVAKCILDPATNVVVARDEGQVVGFAIMKYLDEEAHLVLLAVQATHQERGIGSALLTWLETSAMTAGIGLIYLDARTRNMHARAFYRKRGYRELGVVRGFYRGKEDSIRILKELWPDAGAGSG